MTDYMFRNFRCNRRRAAFIPLLMAGTLLAGCSSDDGISGFGFGSDGAVQHNDLRTTVPYSVELTGIDPHEEKLIESLNETSTARRLQSQPPGSRAGLQRRAEDDLERFQAVLRSNGFYDAEITFDIEEKEASGTAQVSDDGSDTDNDADSDADTKSNTDTGNSDTDAADGDQENSDTVAGSDAPKPVVLTYHVDPGTPYLLDGVTFKTTYTDKVVERAATDAELEQIHLEIGQRARANPIILAEQFGVDVLRQDGYPLAKAGDRRVVANTAEKTLSVTYAFDAGAQANFGAVEVKGAEEVDPDFIAGYRSWGPGQKFNPDEIRTTRQDLAKSNLFDSVVVKPVGPVGETGEVPIEITVVERKHRSVGGGVNFSTADGPGANAFWEHRNLFGRGEKLRLGIEASGLEQGLTAEFRKPQFLRRRQALVAESNAKNHDTDAYQGTLFDNFVGVERKLGENWSGTFGVTAEYSDLTGTDSPNEQFYLGGLRGILKHDNTDNPLDPTEGNRFEINVSPYVGLNDSSTSFTSVSLSGSQYLSIDDDGDYVMAARARTGTIIGEERGNLPSNKRFYSGGGGSIRGYEYQKVGPLAEDGDPLGGRSVLEVGFEFRARITESFGIVPFIEGGNVYERSEPGDISLLWATGLGFRYYTAVGPLRFDIAVPLDKRENVDDDYQFYISLGQAF
ncbi:autotransporter assembly complex protein TamA [Thalassospira lucentensis]|uniref:autotransporter assembly complex protein TamA n=1 Tax=Thalassospira lucentensis TaxID=168935 RepID=UPI0020CA54E7|nr:autotransporter assembly complex family protein [Thalassospira lucentensis]